MIDDGGMGAAEARERVLASTVFTTHTPVPAGNEAFEPELARAYLEPLAEGAGMEWEAPSSRPSPARRTRSASRRSPYAPGLRERGRGAPRRHVAAHVRALWPELPVDEVPIASITNGIHTASWLSREMQELLDRYVGPACASGRRTGRWERDAIPGGSCGACTSCGASAWCCSRASACAPSGRGRARAARQPGGRRRAPPRRPDHLLRAPVRHLQAGEPPLPRPRAARPAARRREAARAADRRRQGAPADGPGKDVLRGVVRESQRPRCATASSSSRTTTCTSPATSCRAPTCG